MLELFFFFLFRFKRSLESRKMGPISKEFNQKNVKSCKKFFKNSSTHLGNEGNLAYE